MERHWVWEKRGTGSEDRHLAIHAHLEVRWPALVTLVVVGLVGYGLYELVKAVW